MSITEDVEYSRAEARERRIRRSLERAVQHVTATDPDGVDLPTHRLTRLSLLGLIVRDLCEDLGHEDLAETLRRADEEKRSETLGHAAGPGERRG